jgi:lipooligosaccharide transport system permease protein
MTESLFLSFNIVRRNWTVYKKDLIANISPTVADPMLILFSLGMGLGAFVTDIHGKTYAQFLAPGLTVATALFTSFFESSYGFYVRMTFENVFKAMLTTPIGVREIVLGEFIWVGLKGAVMSLGVTLVLIVFGLMNRWELFFLMAPVGALVAIPCGGLGLLATSYVRNINQFQTVYSFLIAPLYFLSGAFFPMDQMHPVLQWANWFFPLYHGVALAQSVFWNRDILHAFAVNGSYLALLGTVLGLVSYYRIRKKLQA